MNGAFGNDNDRMGLIMADCEENNELKKDVLKVYSEVTAAADGLVAELRSENEHNDEEIRKSVDGIIDDVATKSKAFETAVAELANDCEFDKFTIAFFGQTNAGKSTIIEALRILFDEEGRQSKIANNLVEKERLAKEHEKRCENVIRNLEALKKMYRPRSVWSRIAWPLCAFMMGLAIGAIYVWRFM